MTTEQLVEEAKGHYFSQGVKQAYVFILGLEVLGNPYGLFRDVKEGISDFFYEPYLVSRVDKSPNAFILTSVYVALQYFS